MQKQKAKRIAVDPRFYARIEKERQKFMRSNGLTRLTTTAFTGILEARIINGKNNIGKKRRR